MLTKDSFPLTHIFLCNQTVENIKKKNYLYTMFSIKTNEAYKQSRNDKNYPSYLTRYKLQEYNQNFTGVNYNLV